MTTDPVPDWPYCSAAKQLSSPVVTASDGSSWDKFEWKRRLEIVGSNDETSIAKGPNGEIDGLW